MPMLLQRLHRHRSNPLDIRTWHEVEDFQPRVVQLLRMGAWTGFHVRQQGWRAEGLAQPGVVQGVHKDDGQGVPDWWCYSDAEPNTTLVLELKAVGKLPIPAQRAWLARLASRPGYEVAVVTPQHLEVLRYRLVLHRTCGHAGVANYAPATCMGWCQRLWWPTERLQGLA